MRVPGLLHVIAIVACLSPLTSTAQTEPFHKHRDTLHGHDHYYPDRGAIVRDLPVGTIGTSYAGVSYRYHDGIWLEPRGPAYMVVSPPIGLIAPTLPLFSTVVAHGADSFLYCNDTYYRPRPDLGGYEVVNDPAMEVGTPPAAEALVGGQMPAVGAGGGGGIGGAAGAVGSAGAGGAVGAGAAVGNGVGGAMAPGVGVMPGTALAVPVVAREMSVPREGTVSREASLSGGTLPGVGAAAASVPAPSLGASAGTSASAAPAAGTSGTQKVPKVFLYPRSGQSADQQARDRYDCYRFAVGQSGFDPLHAGASPPGGAGEQQSDFERAQSACFEARGYSSR
jgi:hypothetical protein